MTEDLLELVGFLDGDADADRVDGRLNQHSFVLIAANDYWRE